MEAVLAAVRTPALALTPGTYEALALAIGSLVAQLRVTEAQRRICRQRLATLVREVGPTAVILQSHAGIDVLVAAALLGEAPRALARPDLPTLRMLAGTAPVTRRSGRSWRVGMRRLTVIADLSAQIVQADRAIVRLGAEVYPETQLLRQVAGVGPLTVLTFILTIEDPHRFPTSRAVGAYLGLVPRQRASGQRQPQLRITKAGDQLVA